MDKCHNQIAVGIIVNQKNQIFITHRLPGKELSEYWEFPGGKVEANESVIEALQRELYEELGIHVLEASHFSTIEHTYLNKKVVLHFYLIDQYDGKPFGKEGQKTQWVSLDVIHHFAFPEANKTVLMLLQTNQSSVKTQGI